MAAYTKLEYTNVGRANGTEIIPLVLLRKDRSCADVGFVARAWVSETFKWVMDNAPQPHLNRLLGLILGYSPDAIAALDESESGRLFPYGVSGMAELASNPPLLLHHKEGSGSLVPKESPSCVDTEKGSPPTVDKLRWTRLVGQNQCGVR